MGTWRQRKSLCCKILGGISKRHIKGYLKPSLSPMLTEIVKKIKNRRDFQ